MGNALAEVKPNLLDRVIGYVSPMRGARRAQARALISCYGAVSGESSFDANKNSPYNRKLHLVGGEGDDHLCVSDLFQLRETSRLMDLNNGLSMSIMDRVAENVVGPGGYELKPQISSKDLNKQATKDLNKKIAEDFHHWFHHQLDHRRESNGWPLIRTCYRGSLRDGDSWGEYRYEGDGSVMMFEGCRVISPEVHRTPKVRSGGKLRPMHNGVVKDRDGRKSHLWIADKSPSTPYVSNNEGRLYNAKNFVQFYNSRRLTFSRGIPVLAPVIREVNDIDDLLAFERTAAKKVASMNIIVKTSNPGGVANLALGTNQEVVANQRKQVQYLDPMKLNYFSKDVEISDLASNHPNTTFEPFIELLNRYVGLPVGLPLELVLLDFSKVNFASSRQLLNQAQLHFKCEQESVGFAISWIYERWLEHRLDRGDYPRDKMGPYPFNHTWGYTGWPSPNPLQDVLAAAKSVETGLNSRTSFNRSAGRNQEDIFNELREEEKAILGDELRLLLYMLLDKKPEQFEQMIRPDDDLDEDEQGGTDDVQ